MSWLQYIPADVAPLTPEQLAAARHSHLAPLVVRDTLVATIYQAWADRDELQDHLDRAQLRTRNMLERARLAEAELQRVAPDPRTRRAMVEEFEDRLDALTTRNVVLDQENQRLERELAHVRAQYTELAAAAEGVLEDTTALQERTRRQAEAVEEQLERVDRLAGQLDQVTAERDALRQAYAEEQQHSEGLRQQLQRSELDGFVGGYDAGARDVLMRNSQTGPAEAYLLWCEDHRRLSIDLGSAHHQIVLAASALLDALHHGRQHPDLERLQGNLREALREAGVRP